MDIKNVVGFDWVEGNWPKCGKHGVSRNEIENYFQHEMKIAPDPFPISARYMHRMEIERYEKTT